MAAGFTTRPLLTQPLDVFLGRRPVFGKAQTSRLGRVITCRRQLRRKQFGSLLAGRTPRTKASSALYRLAAGQEDKASSPLISRPQAQNTFGCVMSRPPIRARPNHSARVILVIFPSTISTAIGNALDDG